MNTYYLNLYTDCIAAEVIDPSSFWFVTAMAARFSRILRGR